MATNEAVEDLRLKFIARLSDPSRSWQDVAELFITHEASLGKLRAAAGILLRSAAQDEEKRLELFAEAGLAVFLAFKRHRDLKYVDGLGSFDSWLYSVWKTATSHALRQLNRGSKLVYIGAERLERESSSNGRAVEVEAMLSLREVLAAIEELPPGLMREVMLDWAAGFNGADSARQRKITEAWVSKLRGRGVAVIRERFGLNPPAKPD